MDAKAFAATQIIKVLDKNRRTLTDQLKCGIITEDEERGRAVVIAAIAEELGLFFAYAFYHTQEPINGQLEGCGAKR